MNKLFLALICGLFFLTSCKDKEPIKREKTVIETNFNDSIQGWVAGFADYPEGEDDFYELDFGLRALPSPLDETKKGFMLSGNNHSDDLFMYLYKKVDGLDPLTEYSVLFDIKVATDAPVESVGVGGSPGSSVFLKVGALAKEPTTKTEDEMLRADFDKGQQAEGGETIKVIGDMNNGSQTEYGYNIVSRDNLTEEILIKTNDQGELWLILGTDSGFEGLSTFYYTQVDVVLAK